MVEGQEDSPNKKANPKGKNIRYRYNFTKI